MGLEDFIEDANEEDEEVYHHNPILDKEKLHNPELCSSCGKPAEHIRGSEYRCTTDSDECSVVYYITTDFEIDYAKM